MTWKSRWDKLGGRGCKKCVNAIVGASIYVHRGKTLYPSEYNSWRAMKARCKDPKYWAYKRYGGRGIKVCERWLNFENFIADMGRKPSPKHSLDRLDGDRDYTPQNCRWSDQYRQMSHTSRSRLLTINGETRHMADWARFYGVNLHTVYSRAKRRGWTLEEALKSLI